MIDPITTYDIVRQRQDASRAAAQGRRMAREDRANRSAPSIGRRAGNGATVVQHTFGIATSLFKRRVRGTVGTHREREPGGAPAGVRRVDGVRLPP